MGRDLHYRPGSFYRVDDRTGFPQRAERTRKEWNNLIVDEGVWEPRQPQDLVRGVKDDQTVMDARPLSPATFHGNPIYVPITQCAEIGDYRIYVEYIAGLTVGDLIGVMLDNGIEFRTTLLRIDNSGDFITMFDPLPYPSCHQLVVDYRIPGRSLEHDGYRITEEGYLRGLIEGSVRTYSE